VAASLLTFKQLVVRSSNLFWFFLFIIYSVSMSSVSIRKFDSNDQDTVHALYLSGAEGYTGIPIVGQCYSWFIRDKLKPDGDMSNIQSYFMANINKSCFWVAELDDKIVGFVGAIPSSCLKFCENCVELERMFVSPTVRQLGVGRGLIATLEFWAKEQGYENIYLSTLGALTEPNQLYPKCGFILQVS
jgi:GNAT superfamily N-acetyltransferase